MMIKREIIKERLSAEERKLHIYCTLGEDGKWVWEADTTIGKYITAFKKHGWEQTSETILESDGTVQGATFRTTSSKPITIRNIISDRPKRVISEEHKAKLLEAAARKRSENKESV